MGDFIAQIWDGLATGSIYALTAVSVTFLMVVAGFIQFAHGEVVVLAMYIAWLAMQVGGESVVLTSICAVGAAMVLTILLEPLTRRLRLSHSNMECLILTVAFGMILTEMMTHFFNFGMPVRFPATVKTGGYIKLGVITTSLANLYVMLGCVVVLLCFTYFLYRTKFGKAMRAVAIDFDKALMLGLPVQKTVFLSFTITGLLAGITAVLLITALGFASPHLGGVLSLRVLAVMLFAGLGNFMGAVVCGIILGVVEGLTTGYFIGAWTDAIAMGIIMITVMIKPSGLFGTKV